ncbi:MAG: carbon monoxide dehydrogenase subunit G [Anaerolineae bacterium]
MKLEGEYIFDGPREAVWEIVRDPEVLATALPGTQSLEQVSENEYAGKMHVRIGPVSGIFAGKIVVSDEVPPESCTLSVEGRGAPGFANGTGHVRLAEQEGDKTLLKYDGEMQVGGRIASVGQRLIDTASKSMIGQGLESLNNALQARMTAEAGGEEAEYVPPTEAEFAAAVAKDMAKEMLPPPQTLGIILALAAAILIFVFWLGSRRED